jgi:hypothetical protein
MKRLAMLLAGLVAVAPLAAPAYAQKTNKEPKSEITKLRKARKTDRTVRQVTPDPKKSPGKHADNLSKNVNHELDRTSKNINHFFQGKKKKK